MEKKDQSINIRCTKKQKATVELKAEKSGVSISDYVLKKALNSNGKIKSTKEDMARCNAYFQLKLNELERMVMDNGNLEVLEKVKEIQKAEDARWKL